MKPLKFVIALALLVPCVALTLTLWRVAAALVCVRESLAATSFLWLALGSGSWLATLAWLSPSARAYIIGHELTHAVWTLLMLGRVRNFRAGTTSGEVIVSRSNWLVTLAPYFFPLYTLLAIGLFHLASLWGDVRPFAPLLFYVVGFTWTFHATYTLAALRRSQADLRRHGWLFSVVVIYGMNILVVLLLIVLLSGRVTLLDVTLGVGRECRSCWRWLVWTWEEIWPLACKGWRCVWA
ncbi:MAG: hypothetical protein N2689_09905, partial [Verrucomicrobiae bacterium]|nr:hypothetical protein [Verrucomicrobiae bacterium]